MSFTTRRLLSDSTGSQYRIPNSLRFRSSASAYLSRTPTVAGSLTTWTMSAWVKRGSDLGTTYSGLFGSKAGQQTIQCYFDSDDSLTLLGSGTGGGIGFKLTTSGVFRDTSAWYHIVAVLDTTQATAADRVRLYVNGSRITTFSTNNDVALNDTYSTNKTTSHYVGATIGTAGVVYYTDGYLTEVNFIDGQALDPLAFGNFSATTGVWTPARYTGTYGTNGFYLKFTDTSSNTATGIGKDSSGNGNNWTPNNISLTAGATYDSMIDTPTPYNDGGYGRGNYAVLNPLANYNGGGTLSNGNLSISLGPTANNKPTFGASTGKWYAEITCISAGGYSGTGLTIDLSPGDNSSSYFIRALYCSNGNSYNWSTSTYVSYGSSWTTGDVIGIAWNGDDSQVTFYKNGVAQPTITAASPLLAYNSSGNPVAPIPNSFFSGVTTTFVVNYGQRPFAYTPPTGFKTLCTQNLPTPAIVNPAQFMAATTYAGTGATQTIANTVNNRSFQPDLVWIKGRSAATDHALYDSVRGATKDLVSNSTAAETTQATGLTTFGSTGFSIGNLAKLNTNAQTYVAWQWKAGDSTVTNTAGTITSQVDANPTAGFSVVSYTANDTAGATIGHGLGKAPSFIIGRKRNNTSNWQCYHTSLGATKRILLNTTNAAAISVLPWNNTEPTTTLITLGRTTEINDAAGEQHIIYCFAEVDGFSKFGSYTGNGSADGPFVYCGLRPKWVMFKRTDGTSDWRVFDTQRNPYNLVDNNLKPNAAQVDDLSLSTVLDILSNGFKIRASSTSIAEMNASGGTYIFAAFAEAPFKYALAR
jgi:hypothetical protein